MMNEMKDVATRCPHCGEYWSVKVKLGDFFDWTDGKHVQAAFPYLNEDERELFLTGYCTGCWDLLFKDDS